MQGSRRMRRVGICRVDLVRVYDPLGTSMFAPHYIYAMDRRTK